MISTVLPSDTRRCKNVEQLAHIVKVKARRGLVENVERAAGLPLRKFARELDALRFAARERRCGLSKLHVAEPDFDERRELLLNLRDIFQQLQRFARRHIQHVGDRMALEAHRQRFGVVAAAAADFAHHIYVGQKIHFDAAQSVALARFAAAALHVEAESAGLVAAFARFGQHREKFANRSENAGVSRGIRSRRAADRRLVDLDHFIDVLDARHALVRARRIHRAIELLRQRAIENVVDERGFARTGNAGDHRQQAERQSEIDILKIVFVRAKNLDRLAVGAAAFFRDWDASCTAEILARQ